MIRAGRNCYVQTMADLAAALGMPLGTFRNKRIHAQEGYPAAISSERAQTLLWDGEQTAAFHAGKPVPEITDVDSDEDLLDLYEASAEVDVAPVTFRGYKDEYDLLREHVIRLPEREAADHTDGVEHWPRRILREFKTSRPGKGFRGGRPTGSGDMIPRDQIHAYVEALLDANPAISSAQVTERLHVATTTAMSVLATLRGRRIVDLLEAEPHLSPRQAVKRLGYPSQHRRALQAAAAEQRARQVLPYLQSVADALYEHDLADATTVEVAQLAHGVLASAIALRPAAPSPALVWDQRYGWRTAVNRRHPIGKDTGAPPEGEGIRYLDGDAKPPPQELLSTLADGRRGSRRPQVVHPTDLE